MASNASRPYVNPYGCQMGPCNFCGFCSDYGCINYSKASPNICIIPVLRQRKEFELRANAHVQKVNLDVTGKRATSVTYLDAQGREIEQPADLVLLCAFSLYNVHLMLLPTSLVGSYPQPDWLIDRAKLAGRFPPRVRARELWRVAPEFLDQAQADATLLAIRAQEDAGLDIITDGEIRRESYSNRFATALDGVDIDNPGTALDRSGHPNPVPRVVGPIRRKHPVEVSDLQFLRAHTTRTVKITVPGPFTMSQQAQDDYYGSKEALAFGYAEAVNEEIRDLFAAGADIVQLDEPYLQARSAEAAQYGVKVINRALDGLTGLGTTALHLCFGYAAIIHERPAGYSFLPELAACDVEQISIETAQSGLDCSVLSSLDGKTIILGVIDLNDPAVETPDVIVERVRRALPYVDASRLVMAPDCGMKYIPRDTAFGKLAAMSAAAVRLRAELGS